MLPGTSTEELFEECRQNITYKEMKTILEYQPCVYVPDNNNSNNDRRVKRSVHPENKINTINRILNEHRVMINYLLNTSINATLMKYAIYYHHHYTGPSWRSWRDVTNVICLWVLFGSLLYMLLTGCKLLFNYRTAKIKPNRKVRKQFKLNDYSMRAKYYDEGVSV